MSGFDFFLSSFRVQYPVGFHPGILRRLEAKMATVPDQKDAVPTIFDILSIVYFILYFYYTYFIYFILRLYCILFVLFCVFIRCILFILFYRLYTNIIYTHIFLCTFVLIRNTEKYKCKLNLNKCVRIEMLKTLIKLSPDIFPD